MQLPTILDKAKLDLNQVAQEVLDSDQLSIDTPEEALEWVSRSDVYICAKTEEGFEGWSLDDYARNLSENNFEPYAIYTKNYVVIHDYV